MKYFTTLMILLFLLPVCVFSEIYIWTDANGVKHVSDTPPPQSETIKDYRTLESSPARSQKATKPTEKDNPSGDVAATDTSAAPPKVTMFTRPGYKDCDAARRWFTFSRIPFQEYNIDASVGTRNAYEDLGGKGMPLIVIDQHKVIGWDLEKVKELLHME